MVAEGFTGELIPTEIWHLEEPERFEIFRKVTENTRFTSGVGLPGRVLANGKPAWVIDVTRDSNFPRAKQAEDIGVKVGFAFPVLVKTEIVAVLEFFSEEAMEPDERLLGIMTHIGTQLGRVVERKRGEEVLRKAHKELELHVHERTAELAEANKALQAEIKVRKWIEKRLRESEENYRNTV
jgi:Signal transduction histidine kinase regulating C4-dicarboxylate transport system